MTEEELNSLKMYFIVLFNGSGARYIFNESTIETIGQDFELALQEDLVTVFSMRYGQ